MAKRRGRRRVVVSPRPGLQEQLASALKLLEMKQWDEALDALCELNERYPRRIEVLSALAIAAAGAEEVALTETTCEQILELEPNNQNNVATLASVYILNGRPCLAIRVFRGFFDRRPDDSGSRELREAFNRLGKKTSPLLVELGLDGDDRFELGAMHEEAMLNQERGDIASARRISQALLKRAPAFVPGHNARCEMEFEEGRIQDALLAARKGLESAPDSLLALSSLIRYLVLSGNIQEANSLSERLKAFQGEALMKGFTIARALSFACDDEGVLSVYRETVSRRDDTSLDNPLFRHLAAVAACRMERVAEARRFWKKALKLDPELDLAIDNLDDLKKPAGNCNSAWPFSFDEWAPEAIQDDLVSREQALESKNISAAQQAAAACLKRHPAWFGLIPALLDRGAFAGTDFAFIIATNSPDH